MKHIIYKSEETFKQIDNPDTWTTTLQKNETQVYQHGRTKRSDNSDLRIRSISHRNRLC